MEIKIKRNKMKEEIQIDIKELKKLRPNLTVPQLSKHFGINARKIEKLLSKHKIRK